MNIIERGKFGEPAEYVNSFRVYTGSNEIVVEFGQVDLVASLKTAKDNSEPDALVLDVKGRYVIKPENAGQLINSLVAAIAPKQQQKGKSE
jgi:hypothetical protein